MNTTRDAIAAAYCDAIAADKARNPRVEDGDYIRIARIHSLTNEPADKVTATLLDLAKARLVELAPESCTLALTADDRATAVRLGSEDMHLVAFPLGYFED